jgi:hypothetical protein
MKRFLTLALLVGLSGSGIHLFAQQQQPNDEPGTSQQPRPDTEKQAPQTSQGKIVKAGNQLAFKEASTQTTYRVDDQSKVAPFEGKDVKIMVTVNPKTNVLHVIDIAPTQGPADK